jgi:PleD family two-component response regulator
MLYAVPQSCNVSGERRVFIDDDEIQNLSPAEAFRRAKVDHHLERARECFQMGRYLGAEKSLDAVFGLEKENAAAMELRRAAADALAQITERAKNGSAAATGDDAAAGRARRKEVVLVVDQDERILTSLVGTLHRYGFLAMGAASYDEAVELIGVAKADVVISEVNFESGPRGYDLYLWLKTNFDGESIPFLFLATRIDRDTLIAGKRFGVDDMILKPVDDDVVIASVINCLSRRKARGIPA